MKKKDVKAEELRREKDLFKAELKKANDDLDKFT
jgi:hypothetical protein